MQLTVPIRSNIARPLTELIEQARQGVRRRRVDEVANFVGLTDKDMARILNMSVRSLHSKTNAELLTSAASERLLLLERLVQHGLAVFDGRADLFARWLHTPLAELAYRPSGNQPQVAETQEPRSLKTLGSYNPPSGRSLSPVDSLQSDLVFQSPLTVLDTVSGFSLAEDVLGRIEWGILG